MGMFCGLLAVCVLACVMGCAAPQAPHDGGLVANGDFRSPGADGLPARWTVWKPEWERAACAVRATPQGLLVESPHRPYGVGGACQDLAGIEGGHAYAVEALCEARRVPHPERSVLVRVNWTRQGKLVHPAGMLVRGPAGAEGKWKFQDVLVAPKEADGATLSLEAKWLEGGSVLWEQVSVRPAAPPSPRKVKVGTVYLRPKNSTPRQNLDLFCRQIDEAGRLGLDIVCLPETILAVGTSAGKADCAEPIPGPSTEKLGAAAKKNRIWVVAGLLEREGELVYNTAVLLDRQGRLAGKYRKVHLPREEWKAGVTPGGEYPVFRTDFGVIAIQICYDWFFPEPEEIFALQGAEIIFAPTWGNTLPDQDGCADGESAFRVRARDNGVYMVPSVYDGSSMIIDPLGRILVSNRGKDGVFWAEIDLNDRPMLPWVGHWGSIGPRDRMPGTYGRLMKD